jgi:CBS domain-containing protein
MRAGDVMTTGAARVRPDAPLVEAVKLMVQHQISGLPVVDGQEQLVGLITEADFLRAEAGKRPRLVEVLASTGGEAAELLNSRRVETLMTRDPISIGPETPLEDVVELMHRHNIRRLPVVAQGKVVGVVSRANLLLALLRRAQADPR